jgi:signal transduction histidine kinase
VYDAAFEPQLKAAMMIFSAEYDIAGRKPELLDFQKIRTHIEETFGTATHLYLIDSKGTIRYSTERDEIGLDFSVYPDFFKRLNQIRLGNSYESDVIVRTFGSGEYRKFGYQPTPDHKYIMEIGLTVPDFEINRQDKSLSSIANLYSATVSGIRSVFVFDKSAIFEQNAEKGIENPDLYNYSLLVKADRLEALTSVFKTGNTVIRDEPDGKGYRKYIYVPPPDLPAVSSSEMGKVIEITYDLQVIKDRQHQSLILYLTGAIIAIFGILVIAYAVSRYITGPIDEIISDIEEIANGRYDHPIRHTRGFEFKRLEDSIAKMVQRLKDDIVSIKATSEKLDTELSQRRIIEEALRKANKKLHLLGSITRHDILNQITVITGVMDIIFDELPTDSRKGRIFENLNRAVSTIQKQISFTGQYEQMGVYSPIWQRMSDVCRASREELFMPGVQILDSTTNLEILADPMFNRVIYNLLENAIRHGSTATRIELLFYEEQKAGILIIQDDGCGIPDDAKERIFERGYGSNTGFGLFLVREILEITGITIQETGKSGSGARFEICIPPQKWRNSDPDIPQTQTHLSGQ